MILGGVLAIVASSILLIILGASDPKRVRTTRRAKSAGGALVLARPIRHMLGWLTLAPGLVLAVIGEWWGFVVWLGIVPGIGWAIAHVLRDDSSPSHSRRGTAS